MKQMSRQEMANQLGIDYEMLTRLITYGIVRPSVRLTQGQPGSVGYRGNLFFTPEDFDDAERALHDLKWLAVVIPDSWERLTADGLRYTLLSQRYERIAQTLRTGNKLLFYVTGVSAFCGTAEVCDRTQRRRTVWPQGAFPYRVPLKPDIMCAPNEGVRIKSLIHRLNFITKKHNWEQYFRSTIRLITNDDYQVVAGALAQTSRSISATNISHAGLAR